MATKKTLNRRLLAGRAHQHGCIVCHIRYEDACEQPFDNERCVKCRGGRRGDVLVRNAAPRECCRADARLATTDERIRYYLGGRSLWFICPHCFRIVPFEDPKTGHLGYEAVLADTEEQSPPTPRRSA